MQNYSRPLDTNEVVEDFLKLSLQFDYAQDPKLKKIIAKIVDGELGVSKFNTYMQTMSVKEMRHAKYRDEDKRWKLREKIINQLWTKGRLTDDEQITLTKGGALPQCGVKFEKQVFILIGLPASGKSSVATREIAFRFS